MKKYEKILKALANRRRLQIVKFLKDKKEANVGEISTHIKLSYKSTSKHLSVLSGADLVEREQRSLENYYTVASKLDKMAKAVISLL